MATDTPAIESAAGALSGILYHWNSMLGGDLANTDNIGGIAEQMGNNDCAYATSDRPAH